ncbi:MAG: phosphatidylglycerophosphate synthase [Actinomycetia bacterium]|nr:phosphatidylglycerophosphate synthase [Actinomycetes bacterium]
MSGAAQRRVVTIPNVISLVRLLCVPVFLWLLWGADRKIAAGVLFAVLSATDWVDGYIARHFNQGSELGKILDPTADRVLLVAGAVGLLAVHLPVAVNVILWVVLVREVLIAVATVSLGALGARRIDVVWAGKAGTLALMFALPFFLVADNAHGSWAAIWSVIAWGFAIGGIGLGYYAAMKYVPAARVALREGRASHGQSGNDIAEVSA